ncbi:hypothetical protein [Campylobacter mucosalis]|uniref:hypothetical protein n=1 Tax=Campylobacter mucosalis TaxID=202 RepID=UPI0014702BD7|nr:hypothetical protein [Campylobacter mucosalis]
MDVSISDEIKETANLISQAGAWGINEFLVFMVIFGFIAFVIIFWLLSKNANKNTERVIDLSIKTNEAINNNTLAVHALTTIAQNTNEASRQKLNDIHEDVKEIKFSISHKRAKPSFNEHLKEAQYE